MSEPAPIRAAACAAVMMVVMRGACGAAGVPVEQIQAARVLVESKDAQGHVLQNSLGFVLDETTVVTSYNAVKGAALLNLHSGDYLGTSSRILSCSNFMDLALVKTEELPMDPELAGSDTLATGDPVYYLNREKNDWRIVSAKVKNWRDSGQGYELIQLDPAPAGVSSPLFNSTGKVVGWISEGVTAPLKAIYQFFADKDSSLPLAELKTEGKFWNLFRAKETAEPKDHLELSGTRPIQGTPRFPFELSLPGNWAFETSVQADRYLLLSMNGHFGVTISLRIVPQQTDDLMAGLQHVEALMFPGVPRAEMTPYSTDHFTGMKSLYEDQDDERGYSTTLFCAVARGNLYVLALTYPSRYQEEIQPLSEELLASFKIQQ